jgi:hypothetical protein
MMGGRSLPRRRVRRAVAGLIMLALGVMPTAAMLVTPAASVAATKSTATVTATAAAKSTATPTATAAATPASPTPQTSPLSPGVTPVSPVPLPTTTAAPPVVSNVSTSTAGGSNLSSGSALAIVLGAAIVLGGIAFFIWRDARRRAPVRATEGGFDASRRAGSKAPPKPRKLSNAERKRRKRGRARR